MFLRSLGRLAAAAFSFSVLAVVLLAGRIPMACADCASAPLWAHSMVLTRVASDTNFGPGNGYFACGSALFAVYNETLGPNIGGSTRWTWPNPHGGQIDNFPTPVPLSFPPAPLAVFVAADDGHVSRVSAGGMGGNTVWTIDLRRSGFPADQVRATPTLQLYAFSNSTFRAAWGDDAVFVATRTAAPDQTSNRLVAVRASTGGTQWVFNSTFTQPVNGALSAATVDAVNNRVHFGTEEGFPGQPTLWTVDTVTGAFLWSRPAGTVVGPPQVFGPRVYAANSNGVFQALDSASGGIQWFQVTPNFPLRGVWVGSSPPMGTMIAFTNAAGYLDRWQDTGPNAVELGPPVQSEGHLFMTMPAIDPIAGKAWIGRDDGKVAQVNLASGATEATAVVGPAGSLLYDPTLDSDVPGMPTFNRLYVPWSGGVQRFCIPFDATAVAVTEIHVPDARPLLAPAAPNPFRGTARIEFQLPRDGQVELAVYDARGALVKRLVQATMSAGNQATTWDGTDEAGRRVADGVYLCRLHATSPGAPAVEETKKVVLVN